VIVVEDAGLWGLKLTKFGDPYYRLNVVSVRIHAMVIIPSVMVFEGGASGR